MQVHLPLDQMTIADKLEAMESLWADLSKNAPALPSPDWHRDVLLDRKRLADEGKLQFLDWQEAIRQVREEVRGDSPA